MTDDIAFTSERHLGLVTLQRAQALNALTLPMILALQQQLIAWRADPSIHAVVIRAVEGKAFCAGGDVRWIYEAGQRNHAEQMQFFWHEYRLNHFIHHFPKPYIALMDGVTMGGGVGISLHGSHPVASERFMFAMPETGIGFFPDIGASYLLARCPHRCGIYLGLTGNRLGASDAQALGLVKEVVLSEKFPAVLASLMDSDLSKDAYAEVERCLEGFAMPIQHTPILDLEKVIERCFNYTDVESILAALEAGKDEWHQVTLHNLKQKAPLSLKVTLAQIQKAASKNLAECLKMDYCLVNHFMQDHDFYEGVRALLIDKDKSPHWKPDSLSQIASAQVAAYFEKEQEELIIA